jgi:hypothetical protein
MTANLRRITGALATLAAEALAGRCGIGECPEAATGYIQGASNRPVGVCAGHAAGAVARGYTVHTEVPQ